MAKLSKLTILVIGALWVSAAFAQKGEGALLQRDDFLKLLEEGRRLLSSGDTAGACPQFFYVIKNGDELEAYHQVAHLDLARCLLAHGLPLSAYLYVGKIIDAGEAHPAFMDALPLLLTLASSLEGDMSLLERVAAYDVQKAPEALRDQVNYLAGRYLYQQGDLEGAAARFLRVGTAESGLYLRAKFLEAVVHVREGEMAKGLETFKDILRFKEGSGARDEFAEKVYDHTFLNMARLFYSVEDFETALKYYGKLDKESPLWVQALFESSWAYFRLGNYSKAMGNLWTISSPYFEEEFYPEAFLVEANILFERCHYDEALDIITRFHEQYYKLYTELKTQLKKYEDPNEFYFYLARLSKQGGDLSLELKRIFNAAFMNRNLRRLLGMVVRLGDEARRVEDLTRNPLWNDLATELQIEVGSYRDLIVGEAGDLSKTRLREIYSEIKGLLAKGIKLKIETINKKKKLAEDLTAGKVTLDPDAVTGRDEQFWPFTGEFWMDELDSYYFVIESICPAQP